MKKYKVVLVELSAKDETGARRTMQENEICSCKERGTAELIKARIAGDYAVICKKNPRDNEPMRFLSIVH